MKKKNSSSANKKNASSSSSNSSSRAQKHQTTESVGDDFSDDVLNTSISSASPTASTESNELSNKLRLCYDRLLQLEKNANEYNESGNKAEAEEFLSKAKVARKEIENLLREVNNEKKKQNLLLHSKSVSSTSSGNLTTRTTSVTFVASIAPIIADKKREELISKMIETNFSDPTPELIAECKAKGLDLNKKSAKILLTEMCRELMKLENQQPPSPAAAAVVLPVPSSSSSSSSAALTKRIKATSPSPSYASKRDAQNPSIASVFTSALNGVNHYHHMSSSSSSSPSPSKETVAPITAVQEKWRSEEFLEKVMIKVRRRESHEMALRIVDEITLPSLRVLTNTRINYRAETSLTALLKEWCTHKELLLQQQQQEQQLALTLSTVAASDTSSSSVASSTQTPNHDNDFVLSGIIDTWLSEIVIKNVPEMLKNHFESNEIAIKHASREQIAESLANALTEDIYELEILQAKSAYITLRKLRKTKELLNTAKAKKAICNSLPAAAASSYTKEEAEARAAEIESELDQMVKENKKNEIDDHGDRVYEMMAARYGIGSIEDMEAASQQGGDRDRDSGMKRPYKEGSIASSLLEEVMSQWDRKHLIGQFSYALMAAFFLFLLISSVSSSFMAAFFLPHHQSSS